MQILTLFLPLLSFLLLFEPAWGQIPGYIGRKTPISLDVHLFPTLGNYILREESLDMNVQLGMEVERVVSRKASLGLSFNEFSTSTDYDFDNRTGNMKIRGWMLGLNFRSYRFYSRGNIAPIGMYLKPQIHLLNYHITDLDKNFFINHQTSLGRYLDLCLGFTYGTQRMLSNHLFFNLGLEGTWLINVFNGQQSTEDRYLKQRASVRLREFLALSAQAGLGVLLF